jgi:hypothetical protein
MQAFCEVNVKKLFALSVVVALLGSACGEAVSYLPVEENSPLTIYVTRTEVPDAPADGEDDFNTSCSNPAVQIGASNVADSIEMAIGIAREAGYGVVHLCAGTYETDHVIDFSNFGSITIQGDGMDETIISGTGGEPHALLVMEPFCGGEDCENSPSNFNVLTLKDLTLTGGENLGGLLSEDTVTSGGAVTAPLIATERVKFSDNRGYCGGAIALYGWTQALTDSSLAEAVETDSAVSVIEAVSQFDVSHRSVIRDTVFVDNTAVIGGAIGGSGVVLPEGGEGEIPADIAYLGALACANPGPLEIVRSDFTNNSAELVGEAAEDPFIMGGGAVTAIDSRVFILETFTTVDEVVIDAEPYTSLTEAWAESAAAQDTWVTISDSTFTGNSSESGGGAVLALGNTAVSNSTFTNNSSSGDDLFEDGGGALAIVGGLSLTQSRFVGNIAQWGGAIVLRELFSNSPVSVLTRNTFIRNIATTHGGAIAGWTAEGSARGNRFTRNRAPVGSAVSATTETCSRSWSRREVRNWKGNTFRRNSGGRLPVQCYVFVAPEPS